MWGVEMESGYVFPAACGKFLDGVKNSTGGIGAESLVGIEDGGARVRLGLGGMSCVG